MLVGNLRCFCAACFGRGQLEQGASPAAQQCLHGFGPQFGLHPPQLDAAAAEEMLLKRLKAGEIADGYAAVAGKFEQVHVEVPQRRGQSAQPVEPRREARGAGTGQHVTGELQRRASRPHRHPQLVQELRVEVRDYSSPGLLDDVQPPQQNQRDRLRCRGFRVENERLGCS